MRDWSDDPSPADLEDNILYNRSDLLCRKFESNRPTRRTRNIAKFFLIGNIIYFYYYAIYFKRKTLSFLFPSFNLPKNSIISRVNDYITGPDFVYCRSNSLTGDFCDIAFFYMQ